jgi:hypothetical protein
MESFMKLRISFVALFPFRRAAPLPEACSDYRLAVRTSPPVGS